jgi:hypothetical protein
MKNKKKILKNKSIILIYRKINLFILGKWKFKFKFK